MDELQLLKERLQDTRALLASETKARSSLEYTLKLSRDRENRITSELEKLRQFVAEPSFSLESLQAECNHLRTELTVAQKAVADERALNNSLSSDVEQCHQALERSDQSRQTLQFRLDASERDRAALLDELELLRKRLKAAPPPVVVAPIPQGPQPEEQNPVPLPAPAPAPPPPPLPQAPARDDVIAALESQLCEARQQAAFRQSEIDKLELLVHSQCEERVQLLTQLASTSRPPPAPPSRQQQQQQQQQQQHSRGADGNTTPTGGYGAGSLSPAALLPRGETVTPISPPNPSRRFSLPLPSTANQPRPQPALASYRAATPPQVAPPPTSVRASLAAVDPGAGFLPTAGGGGKPPFPSARGIIRTANSLGMGGSSRGGRSPSPTMGMDRPGTMLPSPTASGSGTIDLEMVWIFFVSPISQPPSNSTPLLQTINVPPTLSALTLAGSAPGTLVRCGDNVNAIACGLPNILASLTLVNLTLQGCRGAPSLSINTTGPVAIMVDHCAFHQCAACGGGAISVASTAPGMINLTLTDSWFNGSALAPCPGSDGGRAVTVINPSRVTVTRTVFTHIRTGSDGGALLVTSASPADVLLTGCRFEGITLEATAVPVSGGAVNLLVPGGSLTVDGCAFLGNSIITTGVQQAHGGALHAPGLRTVVIQNSLFANNTATSTGGDGAGGAVYLGVLHDSMQLIDCNFTGNAAAGHTANAGTLFVAGGTDILVEGCLMSGNTATGQGDTHSGALSLDGTQRVNIYRSEFTANLANSTQAAALGGALWWHAKAADSSFRLDHVVAGGNRALTFARINAQGGAVHILTEKRSRPLVHLAACDFHQNEARGAASRGASGGAYGGALTVVSSDTSANFGGNVTIEGSQFWGNTLAGSEGGGGAINLGQIDQVLVRETTFTMNLATWGSDRAAHGDRDLSGGAMRVCDATNHLTLDSVQFVSNTLMAPESGSSFGGALSITSTATTLRGCLFAHNRLVGGSWNVGGGLGMLEDDLTIEGTRFLNNTISGSFRGDSCGGAVGIDDFTFSPTRVAIRQCWFEENSVNGPVVMGGGLGLRSTPQSVELTGLTFLANVASSRASSAQGGGLYLLMVAVLSLNRVNFTANRVSGPAMVEGAGASIMAAGEASLLLATGGGLSVGRASNLTTTGSYLGGNRLRCPGCSTQGGTINLQNVDVALLADMTLEEPPHLKATTYDIDSGGCILARSPGELVFRNVSFLGCNAQQGGGLMASQGTSVRLEGCRFDGCMAEMGGAIATRGNLTDVGSNFFECRSTTGGGIWGSGATVTLTRSLLLNNTAVMAGGVLFLEANSTAVLENCFAFRNKAFSGTGGVLAAMSSSAAVMGGEYAFNQAKEGGVLYGVICHGSAGAMQLCGQLGGAVALEQSTLVALASNFTENWADSSGGALYSAMDRGEFSLEGCRFTGNWATLGGVAFFTQDGFATRCLFESNSASEGGSAFYASAHVFFFVFQSTFREQRSRDVVNPAQPRWAALSLIGVRVELEETTFTTNHGGAIFAQGGSEVSLGPGCTFVDNVAVINGLARPMNVWLSASGLTVSQPELINDTTIPGGTLWVYAKEDASLPHDSPALPPLLPLLDGGLMNPPANGCFDTPLLEVTVQLKDPNTAVSFGAKCYFVVTSGNGTREIQGPRPIFFVDGQGSCPLPDPRKVATDTLILTNDGRRNVTVATFSTAENRLGLILGIVGGSVGTGVLLLLGLGCNFLVRWVRLKRVAARELASWKGYQLATVNFGHLKFVKKVFLADLNGTPVAVKRLVRLQTAAELADFRREVDMMRTLRHPFVVSLVGATFEAPQQIVTEYMARGSLDGLLANHSARLPFQLRLRMAYDMSRGLSMPCIPEGSKGHAVVYLSQCTHGLRHVPRSNQNTSTISARARGLSMPCIPEGIQCICMAYDMSRGLSMPCIPEGIQCICMAYDMSRVYLQGPICEGSCSVCEGRRVFAMQPSFLPIAVPWDAGINYLHTLQPPIIHRDIKSANMLVTDDLRVKVSDFGISSLSQVGGVATLGGTPEFAAPEVLRDGRYLLASDVFSFGIVLWELTVRQAAWKGVPRDQVITRVMQGDRLPAPPPSEFPVVFCELITRCCAQEPETRPTMQQIVERLGAEVEMNPYIADPSISSEKPRRPRRKAAAPAGAEAGDAVLETFKDGGLQAPLLEQGAPEHGDMA
ncbi:putative protein kinase [Paratrimastix pyriformis]|uniref:Protein kinase domain-containing protein n=1 Tax=Paratrimastix pyriformis TaxID=342808 RepID=A0ABQ8U8E0_9EUKA|nr:putative protein kinase [Paratrimastix pyriformis]